MVNFPANYLSLPESTPLQLPSLVSKYTSASTIEWTWVLDHGPQRIDETFAMTLPIHAWMIL